MSRATGADGCSDPHAHHAGGSAAQDAAVRAVLAAWRNPGPRPALHEAAMERLRREWPVLYAALVRLEGAVQADGGPTAVQVRGDALAAIRERYRVSPWATPPTTPPESR